MKYLFFSMLLLSLDYSIAMDNQTASHYKTTDVCRHCKRLTIQQQKSATCLACIAKEKIVAYLNADSNMQKTGNNTKARNLLSLK